MLEKVFERHLLSLLPPMCCLVTCCNDILIATFLFYCHMFHHIENFFGERVLCNLKQVKVNLSFIDDANKVFAYKIKDVSHMAATANNQIDL